MFVTQSEDPNAQKMEEGFIWIPRDHTTNWRVEIAGTDIEEDLKKAQFRRGLYKIGKCKLFIFNRDGKNTGKFSIGDKIEFYLDFKDASQLVWKGKIERIEEQIIGDQELKIMGRFIHDELLNLSISARAENKEISEILKDLVSKHVSGYTFNNVNSTGKKVTVGWSEKPLWSIIVDLANLANFAVYVDVDKDFHFFELGSITNKDEAVVWNDNMLEIKDLGSSTTDIRNTVSVYGEDNEGLPIIHTEEDKDSQDEYGKRETVIKDRDISSRSQAKDIANAKLTARAKKQARGKTRSLFLPKIKPGEKIWIVNPIQKIHGAYQVNKITHKIPEENTFLEISAVSKLENVFRESKEKEIALEEVENPFNLKESFNLTFDDTSNIGTSTNIIVENGLVHLSKGATSGDLTSVERVSKSDISAVSLQIIGKDLAKSSFYFSVDNGITWESISPNKKVTPSASGNKLKFRVDPLKSTNELPGPTIKSVALLYE